MFFFEDLSVLVIIEKNVKLRMAVGRGFFLELP